MLEGRIGRGNNAGMATLNGLEVRTMFPIPIATAHVDDAEDLNKLLLVEIASRRSCEDNVLRSNRYGWQSERDLFNRKEPGHKRLASHIREMVESTSGRLMPDVMENADMRFDGWINLSPRHAVNAPHDHAGAFWSGTYYVSVPEPEDAQDPFSGAIEFIDPRGSIGTSSVIDTPFTRPKFTVRPKAGTMMLWPSFVKHWVHPNRADADRVTIAYNAWFTRAIS